MSGLAQRGARKNVFLLSVSTLAIAVITLIASATYYAVYTPIATNHDIFLPIWLPGLVSAITTATIYFLIGIPIAQSRFHHLPFQKSMEKQLIIGMLALPFLIAITETMIIYVTWRTDFLDFWAEIAPSFAIVPLWWNTLGGVAVGILSAIGLYWLFNRVRSQDDGASAEQ